MSHARRLPLALVGIVTALMLAGCGDRFDNRNGQLVDAGGERGQGGLAFVLLACAVGILVASLLYMDRVRKRREEREQQDA